MLHILLLHYIYSGLIIYYTGCNPHSHQFSVAGKNNKTINKTDKPVFEQDIYSKSGFPKNILQNI
ncbi:hypothetical protein CRJUMX02_1880024 [Escherichia coli]|nr:hypothetical protein CRJUMX02_1880024 [Escherichia coli]